MARLGCVTLWWPSAGDPRGGWLVDVLLTLISQQTRHTERRGLCHAAVGAAILLHTTQQPQGGGRLNHRLILQAPEATGIWMLQRPLAESLRSQPQHNHLLQVHVGLFPRIYPCAYYVESTEREPHLHGQSSSLPTCLTMFSMFMGLRFFYCRVYLPTRNYRYLGLTPEMVGV